MTAFALKATVIIAMTHTTTILQRQTVDMTVVLSAHKEAGELLSLTDTLGMGMSQHTALWVCGDAGVNKPTLLPVIDEYILCNYVLHVTLDNRRLGYWIAHVYSTLVIIWKYTPTYQKQSRHKIAYHVAAACTSCLFLWYPDSIRRASSVINLTTQVCVTPFYDILWQKYITTYFSGCILLLGSTWL